MVLVILIALWAMVLLPPYLKDRRASSRMFSSTHSMGRSTNSVQRFVPLQRASSGYATAAVTAPTGIRTSGPSGIRTSGVSPLGVHSLSSFADSNVVPLRPLSATAPGTSRGADRRSQPGAFGVATNEAEETGRSQTWDAAPAAGLGLPRSSHAARERRRQVLLGLTAVAFVTLLLALFVGGKWIAVNVLVDVVMVGYVILLVRHRQLAMERQMKIEPIRPPVSEQPPSFLQAAPSYLLQSGTGN